MASVRIYRLQHYLLLHNNVVLADGIVDWLNKHQIPYTLEEHRGPLSFILNIQFDNPDDALLFKLTWC